MQWSDTTWACHVDVLAKVESGSNSISTTVGISDMDFSGMFPNDVPLYYKVAPQPGHKMNFRALATIEGRACFKTLRIHLLELLSICLLQNFQTCREGIKQLGARFDLSRLMVESIDSVQDHGSFSLNGPLSIAQQDWPCVTYNGNCDGCRRKLLAFRCSTRFARYPVGYAPSDVQQANFGKGG